ncbi:hypothetical protein EC973_008388 [Apophysomyces ossiformis]|uniref:Uncharacterized protein n=1 Tax=Apophysomyces ossiformis TaxID=679940 RepID=A0A8H7BX23_9FUNG|nr:hypothetical protein EC973_008388 [Apophysomyces ossiformis]
MLLRRKEPVCVCTRRVHKKKKTNVFVILSSGLLIYLIYLILTRHRRYEEKEQRYLTYLPHSGLSNQRIELANALLLAGLLNRTLIVPPAFLGSVAGWSRNDSLMRYFEWLTAAKDFEGLCQQPSAGNLSTYLVRSRCAGYTRFGVIAWSELHDFSRLFPYINIRFQTIVSIKQLQHDLKLKPEDIYIHKDQKLYDWRLYEDQKYAQELLDQGLNYFDSFAGRQFFKVFTVQRWQERKERLLYLGGIFGSTRLQITSPEHIALRDLISTTLQYRLNTPLGDTVTNIVNWMGGKGTFMSIHFRTGDQPFRKLISKNLQNFVETMIEFTGNTTDKKAEECVNVPANKQIPIGNPGSRVRVYIATDHPDPRSDDSALLPWFHQFPCTVILNDVPRHLFAPLDQIHDLVEPRKSLRSHLIPLVDAMVAAHGREVLITPRSTFSKYIEGLHRSWIT